MNEDKTDDFSALLFWVPHRHRPPPSLLMALHRPMPSAETPALLPFRSSPKPPSGPQLPSGSAARPSPQVLRLRLRRRRHLGPRLVVSVGKEETELRVSSGAEQQDVSPEDLECVQQIRRVLELLKNNRDMLFGEIRLTVMIEDPRDAERKRLLGIEDPDGVTRDDLVAALEDVNEGGIPENRVALRLLAKEMMEWPDLEVEAREKSTPRKSLYAKATDIGVDPEVAAKRLNMDWDSAAEIESGDENDKIEIPPAVGYSALYLVTAVPLLIGLAVVLILFYNSLQ